MKTSLGEQNEFKAHLDNLVKPFSKYKKEGKGGLQVERTQMERAGHVGSQECGRQLGVQWGWGLEPQRDGVERTGGGGGGR